MKDQLSQLVEGVLDEASFLLFLKALADDWNDERAKEALHPSPAFGPGANGWEHGTIGQFLESMVAWANAKPIEGTRPNELAPENIWRRAAHIVLAGKYYE
jgi:hypothetical protein